MLRRQRRKDMKRITISILIVCLLVGISTINSLQAQQDTVRVAERVRTSETVLTTEDFRRLGAENVGDALRNITGVYVRDGRISLRDVAPDKVVIILDGQRMNLATGGGVEVATLPIDNVEKIEVLRGGASARYGADAVGGVIIITTRGRQEGDRKLVNLNTRLTRASFNTTIATIQLSNTYNKFSYLASYGLTETTNDFKYTDYDGNRLRYINNDLTSHHGYLSGTYAITGNTSFTLAGDYYWSEYGAPGRIGQLTPKARLENDNKSINASYIHNALFKDFNLNLQAYMLFFDLKYDNPEGLVPIHSLHQNDVISVEASQSGSLMKNIGVAYGYSFRRDDLTSTDVGDRYRNNHAVYANATYRLALPFYFESLAFTPAIRYDHPSDFDAEFSPKISVELANNKPLAIGLQAHVTRSYRAPTFNDLYWPRDSFAEGNPNLSPEKGYNYDAGISISYAKFNDMGVSVNYFFNKLDDLILWAPDFDGLWRPKNIAKTDARGIEATFRWSPIKDHLSINTDYMYLDAKDKSGDRTTHNKFLIYRPQHKVDVTVGVKYFGFELNIINHYVSRRYINAANTRWLDPYNVVDSNISYSFSFGQTNMMTRFEMNNFTDLDYMAIDGSPEPGRLYRFTIGINY
jgi:outer membrane cobalamin receptor